MRRQGHSLNADLEIDECGMICSGLGRSIAQLVIAGIGVQPAIDMLTNRGLEVGDGIIVNEYLESSQTDVLAAVMSRITRTCCLEDAGVSSTGTSRFARSILRSGTHGRTRSVQARALFLF